MLFNNFQTNFPLNITFEVPRLRTFVFKKASEKKIFTIISVVKILKGLVGLLLVQRRRRWPNIISQLGQCIVQTVAQHYFTIGPMYCVIRVVAFRGIKCHVPVWLSELTRDNHPILFQCWASVEYEMKWNESGFRPPLCTYRLNCARRTSWGWWDDWDDTVLQTQDSKFEPWRSEAEHATSRSRRLPTILTFTRGWGRNNCVSFKPPRPGTEPRTLAWKAAVLTTTLGPPPASNMIDRYWTSNALRRWPNIEPVLGR